MGFRITTNMMVKNYRYNLMQSTNNLNDSRTKVETKRNFNSYAEDPAAATSAWRLRRAFWKNENYRSSNTEAATRFQSAYSTMESIDDNLLNGSKGAFEAIKRADNDPEGGARVTLGSVLSELADSLIYSMNGAKYTEHFVFAGNDEMNAPFRWSEDGKTLYYRNVNVNAGTVKKPTLDPFDGQTMVPVDMPLSSADPTEQGWIDYYTGKVGTKPMVDATAPSWDDTATTGNSLPTNIPASSSDPTEQAWIDYYKKVEADPTGTYEKPQMEAPKAAWDDGRLVPQGVNELFHDQTKLDASSDTTKAWYDYHLKKTNGLNPPEPETPVVPDWDLTSDPYGTPKNEDGSFVTEADCKDDTEKAWLAYYKDQADVKKLDVLANEKEIMDTGLGMQEVSDRELIDATAFNRSLPGIKMLGYGIDEDGDPENIAMIMKRLSVLYKQCADDGTFCDENGEPSDEVRDEVYRLLDKFGAAHDNFNRAYSTDIAAQSEFLVANGDRLEEQSYNLQEQIIDIEQVDMADAITSFMWDYNCYSAALKVGTQLLSQSLIDYMA